MSLTTKLNSAKLYATGQSTCSALPPVVCRDVRPFDRRVHSGFVRHSLTFDTAKAIIMHMMLSLRLSLDALFSFLATTLAEARCSNFLCVVTMFALLCLLLASSSHARFTSYSSNLRLRCQHPSPAPCGEDIICSVKHGPLAVLTILFMYTLYYPKNHRADAHTGVSRICSKKPDSTRRTRHSDHRLNCIMLPVTQRSGGVLFLSA